MGNTITLNDGLKTYEIKNQNGELLAKFSFNPTDSDLLRRYNNGIKNLELKEKELAQKGEQTIEDVIEEDNYIKKTIDEIFNAPVSDSFFSIMGVRSLVGGRLFFEFVIETLGNIIKEAATFYINDVMNNTFPNESEIFRLDEKAKSELEDLLER